MKATKILFFCLLCLGLLFTPLSSAALAAEDNVYLYPCTVMNEEGDSNTGFFVDSPVLTFDKAKSLLNDNGTIYLVGMFAAYLLEDQSWDLGGKGTAKVSTLNSYSYDICPAGITLGNMGYEWGSYGLTLSNITIINDGIEELGARNALISLQSGCSLNLGVNTTLENEMGYAIDLLGGIVNIIGTNVAVTGNIYLQNKECSININAELTNNINVELNTGLITPGSIIGTVADGITDISKMICATEGYHFKLIDGNIVLLAGVPGHYQIISETEGSGVITPSSIFVAKNGSQTFTLTPDSSYIVKDVTVDGVSVYDQLVDAEGYAKTYTFTDVTEPHTIAAIFELLYQIEVALPDNAESLDFGSVISTIADYYTLPDAQTVTITNTGNDTITLNQPADSASFVVGALSRSELAVGETATFTVRPKEKLALGTYSETITISTATGNTVPVSTTFTIEPAMFTVTSTGTGGTVTLNGDSGDMPGVFSVQEGTSPLFTITPYPGCSISDLLVDGISVISDNADYVFDTETGRATYVFSAISADHTILAIFDSGTPAGSLAEVYLNGMAENSGDGTTAETAVKTFAEAKALLAKDGIIYITGEVPINGTEYWTLQNYGSAMIKRSGGYTGNMIKGTTNSSLILEEIIIDGGYQENSPDSITAEGSILCFKLITNGSLTMKDGAVLQNNYVSIAPNYYYGGAVTVNNTTFTMDGGVIRDNYTTCFGGGGVAIGSSATSGTFIMNGGEITGNTSTAYYGGGVYAGAGTFTMNGGSICHNDAIHPVEGRGGGVYAGSATFTMNGGTISENNSINGGGVYVHRIFTMNGGTISGNNATTGGGVYFIRTFAMNDGEITGNAAAANGGGIYIGGTYDPLKYVTGTFTASGGTVSGNTAEDNGNGVHIQGANVTISPAPANALNLADSLYLEAEAYLNLGRTITDLPGSLKIKMAAPDDNLLVAQGSDYTVTAQDAAKFFYETYEWEFALNDNQIVLAQLPVSDVISATPENLVFDMLAHGYGAGGVTARTVTVTNISQTTVTLNQIEVSGDGFIASGLSKSTLEAGETATFTVGARTGLPGGYYSETFLISTTDGAKAVVKATLTVGYSITVIPPAEGGTITLKPDKTLFAPGEDPPEIRFIPEPGYQTVRVLVNGTDYYGHIVSIDQIDRKGKMMVPYGLAESITVSAVFELATYNIDASVHYNEGGAIVPSGARAVTGLQDKTFTFMPDRGWHIKAVYVDNVAVNANVYADNTYTFETVTADHLIVVSFAPNEYSVVFHKNADDATGSMEEQRFTYGEEPTALNKNTFTRGGYTFAGWSVGPVGAVVYHDEEKVDIATDSDNATVTLYAVWVGGPGPDDPIYLVTPASDKVYTAGATADGIRTMTVNSGFSGLKYFTVGISPVIPHDGNETVVFVHQRDGAQLGLNATRADFDLVQEASAGFNVLAGDVVKVFIVDELNNATDFNPTILQ